ncbi:MAG: protease complex subunit PrcB family protein [Patescibacteria group bacterium]
MRDLLIILGMCVGAVVIGAWLYLYGPGEFMSATPKATEDVRAEVAPPAGTEVAFSVLGHGSRATGMTERKNYAVYSKEEYARIWKLTGSTEKMPTIDFAEAYVIAVFAGTRATGGYAISVEKVTDTEGARSVAVLIEKPGVGCITTQAITSPYQIIRVPYVDASLSHVDTERDVPCESR